VNADMGAPAPPPPKPAAPGVAVALANIAVAGTPPAPAGLSAPPSMLGFMNMPINDCIGLIIDWGICIND
jgi:hypothetical protein